jgi:hypothetical protein
MSKRRKNDIPSGSDKQAASRVSNNVACRAVSRQRSQTGSRGNNPRAIIEVLLETGVSAMVRAEEL